MNLNNQAKTNAFKRIWQILAPFHKAFAYFVGLLILYEGMQIVEGYVISGVIQLHKLKLDYLMWSGLVLGLLVFDELFIRLDNKIDWHIISKQIYPIFKHLKTKLIAKFLQLDIAWHQQHNSGVLVGKVNIGVEKILDIIEGMSWEFTPTMIQVILTLIPLLFFSPFTALIASIIFAVFMIVTIKANHARTPLREHRHDLYEDEWQNSTEIVRSIETATMFSQRERLKIEYSQLHDEIVDYGTREAHLNIYKYNRWRQRLMSLGRRSILAVWIWQLHIGTMDIATLVFVNVLMEKLFHSFWRFARLFDRTTEAIEAAQRLVKLSEEIPTLQDNGQFKSKSPNVIEFEKVTFSYNQDETVIEDFDLKVAPGEVIALVGPSGAGKTTIRKLVTRLYDLVKGNIKIAGTNIKDWSHNALLALFSYIPQGDEVYIFDDTVWRNITFSNPNASPEAVRRAMQLAEIDEFIESLPQGCETLVGEKGIRLSGGQKQRIAWARAILADRPILFLDEPTGAVDAINEQKMMENLKNIMKGKTVFIVAHRLATIWNIADKIVVIDNGKKVEEGSHLQLMMNNGLYAQMVALQTNASHALASI